MSRQPKARTRKPPVPAVRKIVYRNTNAVAVEPELTHEFNQRGSYSELNDKLHANRALLNRVNALSTAALDASTRAYHRYLNVVHPSASGSPYVNWPTSSLSVNSSIGGGGPPRPAWAPITVAPNPLLNVPQAFNPTVTATATAAPTDGTTAATATVSVAAASTLPVWGAPAPAGDTVAALAAEQIRLSARFHELNVRYHTAMRTAPPTPALAPAPAPTASELRGRTDPTDESVQVTTTAAATTATVDTNASTSAASSGPAPTATVVVSPAAAAFTAGGIVTATNSAAGVKVTPIIASYVASGSTITSTVADTASTRVPASAPASATASASAVAPAPAPTEDPLVTRHVRKLNRRVDHYVDDLVQSLAYRMTIAPPAF